MSEESNSSVPTAPPPLPPSPLEKMNDFPDRFSPMLVKELRQGLRTYTFVTLFLILQGLLALILLTTAAADVNAGAVVSSIIFFFFSLAVLIVQPLRGMSAISSEVKSDTIDLMSLTKLSAWRIVLGKWSSIMGQTALLLLAIAPYLILRYFFGGMQLFAELLLLFTIFLFSGVLTAITVGLSASTLALVRAIPLLASFFLMALIVRFSFSGFDQLLTVFTPDTAEHWFGLIATYLIAAFVGYFFLELAATSIAPSAENRATRKRLAALVVVPIAFITLHGVKYELAWIVSSFLLAMLSLDLFTESNEYPSVVMRPFLRFGPLGRLAARFLAPGWASGILFHLLLFGLLMVISLLIGTELVDPRNADTRISIGIVIGMLYLPLLLLQIFQKRIGNRLVGYLLFLVLLFGLIPLLALLDNLGDAEMVAWGLCFIPQVQPFLFDFASDSEMLWIVWISTTCYLGACLIYALPPLRHLAQLEREETARVVTNED